MDILREWLCEFLQHNRQLLALLPERHCFRENNGVGLLLRDMCDRLNFAQQRVDLR